MVGGNPAGGDNRQPMGPITLSVRRIATVSFLFALGVCISTTATAQTTRSIVAPAAPAVTVPSQARFRELYTKHEYQIPMRDGLRLFTAVYAPKDDSRPCPILLTRTPYGLKPYGVDRYP